MSNLLRSRLWPILAYAACAAWLVVINLNVITRSFGYPPGTAPFVLTTEGAWFLTQFDGLAHYTTTLALATIGAEWLGRRKTLAIVLSLIVVWEVFEAIFQPLIGIVVLDLGYWADTADDLAIGVAGMLTGVFFGDDQPLYTASAMRKIT